MGLEKFKVAPDNKGGRKSGSTVENPEIQTIESAYTLEKDSEEWWEELYMKITGLGEPTRDDIKEMAERTHLLSRTVKQKLTEHGVYEYDEYVNEKEKLLGKFTTSSSTDEDNEGDKSESPLAKLANESG